MSSLKSPENIRKLEVERRYYPGEIFISQVISDILLIRFNKLIFSNLCQFSCFSFSDVIGALWLIQSKYYLSMKHESRQIFKIFTLLFTKTRFFYFQNQHIVLIIFFVLYYLNIFILNLSFTTSNLEIFYAVIAATTG